MKKLLFFNELINTSFINSIYIFLKILEYYWKDDNMEQTLRKNLLDFFQYLIWKVFENQLSFHKNQLKFVGIDIDEVSGNHELNQKKPLNCNK